MARRRLDWSKRALADVDRIAGWYAETASPEVARLAVTAILNASRRLASGIAGYRSGKHGTREYVMRRFPYTLVYRETGAAIKLVRVMHQARQYFNYGASEDTSGLDPDLASMQRRSIGRDKW